MRNTIAVSFSRLDFRAAAEAFLYASARRGCTHAQCCLEHWVTNGQYLTPRQFRELVMDSWESYLAKPEKCETKVSFTFPSREVANWVSTQGTTIRLIEDREAPAGLIAFYSVEISGHQASLDARMGAVPKYLIGKASLIVQGPIEECPPDCPKCAAGKP